MQTSVETYDPILEKVTNERRGLATPRPKAKGGVAYVLYGRDVEPLVLKDRQRLTLGEGLFGGYTEGYAVDLSSRRLELTDELPCKGDAHNFTATFVLNCRVANPVTVVVENIRDAGAVLWTEVIRRARRVSRRYSLGDTAAAEEDIAAALDDVDLHIAFYTRVIETRLKPDQQAVEIGRRSTDFTVWNGLVNNPFAAAYLAQNPGDIQGALAVTQEMLNQHVQIRELIKQDGGRIGPEIKAATQQLAKDQLQALGPQPELADQGPGVQPALPPRSPSVSRFDDEDDEDD